MPTSPERPRKHEEPILRFVGYYRLVTSHQILYFHFIANGLSPSSGDPVIRRLVDEGFLFEEPLDPAFGRASRRVLHLTKDGWARLGFPIPEDFGKAISDATREYRMQFAEMHSVRRAAGWKLVLKGNGWPSLRTWLLRDYRGRLLNGTERVVRERLERLPQFDIPLNLLVHEPSGDLRFIAPARKQFGLASRLADMPNTGLWPTLHFEIVQATVGDMKPAQETIEKWARKARVKKETHHVRHHRSRPLPREFWQTRRQPPPRE